MNIDIFSVRGMARLFTELAHIQRWSEYTTIQDEASKQGLNAFITYILTAELRNRGMNLRIGEFPQIILYHAFQKNVFCDIRTSFLDFYKAHGVHGEDIEEYIKKVMGDYISGDLKDYILNFDRGSTEALVYQISMKIGTYLEVREFKHMFFSKKEYVLKRQEIHKELMDLTKGNRRLRGAVKKLISTPYMEIFHKAFTLNNRIRWAKRQSRIKCGDLTHMFETGVLAWMRAMDLGESEEKAAIVFFAGIYHDFPETFTGDMPSTVKNAIPNMRAATEELERYMMNKHFYRKIPKHLRNAIKRIMIEENPEIKKDVKPADNLAAIWECWKQLKKEPYFAGVILTDGEKMSQEMGEKYLHIFNEDIKPLAEENI